MAKVSIIIPSYNRAALLPATLDSISAQTFSDWEALVVDDGSTDNSFEIATRYASLDPRFIARKRTRPAKGANVCRNQGLAMATGEYIIFLDSDDLLAETCLATRVENMEAETNCAFGVFQAELFLEKIGDRKLLWNLFTEADDLGRFLSLDAVWDITGPIWRKESLTKLGGLDESLVSFHDWDLHTRALISGLKYFRKPIRDHFYRSGRHHPEAINKVSTKTPEHLRSHERMFQNAAHQLQQAGKLNEFNQLKLAAAFWWLAERWQFYKHPKDAARVWQAARALDLISKRQHQQGRIILQLRGLPGCRRVRFTRLFWPEHLFQTGSSTLHRAPLAFLNATPAARAETFIAGNR